MTKEEIIEIIHMAVCEGSLEDCEYDYGDCMKAGRDVYSYLQGEQK